MSGTRRPISAQITPKLRPRQPGGILIMRIYGRLARCHFRSPKTLPDASNEGRLEGNNERNRLRGAATHAWASGEQNESIDLLRQAIATGVADADIWYAYGTRLVQVGRSDAALEALKTCCELSPLHFAGLELLIEVCRIRNIKETWPARAIDLMASAAVDVPTAHREALDFILQYRPELIRTLNSSPDTLVHQIAALQAEFTSRRGFVTKAGAPREPLAEAIFYLGTGQHSTALQVLPALDENQLPADSIRRASRHALNSGQTEDAHGLLTHYLRCCPKDRWAADKHRETRTDLRSPATLAREGFPFPTQELIANYTPVAGRITYLVYNALPFHSAGYAVRTQGLVRALAESRWTVRVLSRLGYPFDMPGFKEISEVEKDEFVDSVNYSRLESKRHVYKRQPLQLYVESYADALVADALTNRPSLIHAASNHANGLAAALAAERLGIPWIYEVRGLWEVTRASREPSWMGSVEYESIARMEADAASRATRVLTITTALADELVRRGVDRNKISVLPNGVDTDAFSPRMPDTTLLQELGTLERTVIGYIGSILDYEGLDLLLSAARILKEKRDDFLILVVGDGPVLEDLRRMTIDLGLEDCVTLRGRVSHDQVERYYSIIDIATFPRHPLPVCEMVSPIKPFEAMAMGIPVVCSDVAALSEFIVDEENGRLHRKGDASSLAHVLDELLNLPAVRRSLGKSGREWVLRERNWSRLAETASTLYEELGARH